MKRNEASKAQKAQWLREVRESLAYHERNGNKVAAQADRDALKREGYTVC